MSNAFENKGHLPAVHARYRVAADRLLEELLTDPYAKAVKDSPAVKRKYGIIQPKKQGYLPMKR